MRGKGDELQYIVDSTYCIGTVPPPFRDWVSQSDNPSCEGTKKIMRRIHRVVLRGYVRLILS